MVLAQVPSPLPLFPRKRVFFAPCAGPALPAPHTAQEDGDAVCIVYRTVEFEDLAVWSAANQSAIFNLPPRISVLSETLVAFDCVTHLEIANRSQVAAYACRASESRW